MHGDLAISDLLFMTRCVINTITARGIIYDICINGYGIRAYSFDKGNGKAAGFNKELVAMVQMIGEAHADCGANGGCYFSSRKALLLLGSNYCWALKEERREELKEAPPPPPPASLSRRGEPSRSLLQQLTAPLGDDVHSSSLGPSHAPPESSSSPRS